MLGVAGSNPVVPTNKKAFAGARAFLFPALQACLQKCRNKKAPAHAMRRGLFSLNPPVPWISVANPVVPTNKKAFAGARGFLFEFLNVGRAKSKAIVQCSILNACPDAKGRRAQFSLSAFPSLSPDLSMDIRPTRVIRVPIIYLGTSTLSIIFAIISSAVFPSISFSGVSIMR